MYNNHLYTCFLNFFFHFSKIDPPSTDVLYELSLNLEPPRSKKTESEQIAELRLENQKLKTEISQLKTEGKSRLIAQQQVLEKIQNSDSKASATVRALLESITEGTSTPNEQLILLKLQLQAALDLCISLTEMNEKIPHKK